jgi:hypothetical protein
MRQTLLDILSQHPDGLLAEDLIRQAGEPADRLRVLSVLRDLVRGGQVRFERPRPTYRHDLRPPIVRPVTA